ncbi:OmpH family outer membrane protein [Adhaeribacter soli]|uniref:OmpH family outer membrane protein n=1 Tax=Adhaeribacter soli TaxID=2607655 RepID=A0A5N1IIF4_9BACT|nr:OmpH family outer membrane protein [Adhaeribacter soli]KAA9325453.1 OmpH family outer membrane protein [Adhaeribacter soli]
MNKRNLIAAIAFFFMSAVSYAQTAAPIKIGYTNVDYVMSQMPESKQIEADLKAYSAQLENQLKSKYQEFETKGQAYQKGAATMTDVVKADKEKELMNLRTSIEEFQKNADVSLQKKQQQLMEPVLDKLQKAIDDVAKENGYTYVFNSDAGYGTTPVLLHGPEDGNISDLVLKKMGVTPGQKPAETPKATTPAATTPAKDSKSKSKGKKK